MTVDTLELTPALMGHGLRCPQVGFFFGVQSTWCLPGLWPKQEPETRRTDAVRTLFAMAQVLIDTSAALRPDPVAPWHLLPCIEVGQTMAEAMLVFTAKSMVVADKTLQLWGPNGMWTLVVKVVEQPEIEVDHDGQ